MKKLLIVVLIITLPIITYFQYVNWKRYNPATDFSYTISDEIDVNYHDSNVVRHYYENAVEIGRFANETYANSDVDVLFPDNTNSEALNASKYYHGLISSTKHLEAILKKSAACKKAGLSNEDVKLVEKTGIDPKNISVFNKMPNYLGMKLGDKNAYVWKLQAALLDRGYIHPLDGNFGAETEEQLKAYQATIATYQSGIIDEYTFMKLFVEGN